VPDVPEDSADAVEHLLADDRVRLHQLALLGRERAGLVDDLVRDSDLAHVVQQRHELRVTAAPCVEAELLGDSDRKRDDIAAVRAGVGIVGLDDVSEQERCSTIGMAELERMVDTRPPLARERAQEAGEREHEQERRGMLDGRQGGQKADGRERRIDGPREAHVADEQAGRDPQRNPLVRRRACEVESELSAERDSVDRPVAQRRRRFTEGSEDEHWTERIEGIAEPDEDALGLDAALQDLCDIGEHDPRSDRERDEPDRQQEEHRHEQELRRNGKPRADLELDPIGERVGADQKQHRQRRGGAS